MFSSLTRLVGGQGQSKNSGRSGQDKGAQGSGRPGDGAGSSGRRRIMSEKLSDPFDGFVRDWEMLQVSLVKPDQAALHHGISRTDIPERLERLALAVTAEAANVDEATEGMGPCMEYLLKREVMALVVQVAILNRPAGLLLEAVKFFQTLIANLDARFLGQQAVNKPLVRLIRSCVGDEDVDSAWGQEAGFGDAGIAEAIKMTEQDHAELNEALVGLMAFVASKLHNAQELLHIFFHDRQRDTEDTKKGRHGQDTPKSNGSTAGRRPASPTGSTTSTATIRADAGVATPLEMVDTATPEPSDKSYDFPLFNYLLRYVHAEGQTGQLARAGLSMVVKIAFETKPLEVSENPRYSSRRVRFSRDTGNPATLDLAAYILGSDFVDVLGASLGAVYGLLPSKLAFLPSQLSNEATPAAQGPTAPVGGGMSLGAVTQRAYEDEVERANRLNIDLNVDVQIIERLQLFVDLLQFVQQDVLARAAEACSSTLGTKAVIAHQLIGRLTESIRLSLMNNILSPSMVESGDRDGSAVAVMSYLEVLLSVLDDASPLTEEILGWLVRQEDVDSKSLFPSANGESKSSSHKLQRRKSAALLLLEQAKHTNREDNFFDQLLHYTIRDLISDNIAPTTSHPTVAAALGLARTFFSQHDRFAPFGLINVMADDEATAFPFHLAPLPNDDNESDPDDTFKYPGGPSSSNSSSSLFALQDIPTPTSIRSTVSLSQHLRELDLYFSMLSALDAPLGADSSAAHLFSSTGYENYMRDAEEALVRGSMYSYGMQAGLTSAPPGIRRADSMSRSRASPRPYNQAGDLRWPAFRHRLDPTDSLLRSIVARLRRFFEQPPELNVSLTATIAAISLCPYRSLEGWLTFEATANDSLLLETGDLDEEESADWRVGPQRVSASSGPGTPNGQGAGSKKARTPIILELLRSLTTHVRNYRAQIPDFDAFLAERRRGLLYVENLNDALGLASMGDEDSEDGSSLVTEPSLSVPATLTTAPSRERLWEAAGWSTKEDEFPGKDVQVLDVRGVVLPPTPEDVDDDDGQNAGQQGKAGAKAASAGAESADSAAASTSSYSTFTRLFGRSPAAAAKSGSGNRSNESGAAQTSGKGKAAVSDAGTDADAEAATAAALPFADHYKQTESITIKPSFVPMPRASPWTSSIGESENLRLRRSSSPATSPLSSSFASTSTATEQETASAGAPPMHSTPVVPTKREKRTRFQLAAPTSDSASDGGSGPDEPDSERESAVDGSLKPDSRPSMLQSSSSSTSQDSISRNRFLTAYPGIDPDEEEEARRARPRVTLSSLLDNVVVLEEFIKELAAIVQVRRGVGVDRVAVV